mgnify:CR=1 FL=1
MKICAATGNAGKLRELQRILEAQGHEVVSQKELGITIEPDETGTTFEENALIKAETICKASGLPTIADDSGLCVDALEGAPGVYSARYCGRHGDDEANNDKLLENMQDIPAEQRGAKFVAAVCFILPTGRHLTCRGECPGKVAFARLAGDYGFGYDPLFIPDECGVACFSISGFLRISSPANIALANSAISPFRRAGSTASPITSIRPIFSFLI